MNARTYFITVAILYIVTSMVLGFILGVFCGAGFGAMFGAGIFAQLLSVATVFGIITFSETFDRIAKIPGQLLARFVKINPVVMPKF